MMDYSKQFIPLRNFTAGLAAGFLGLYLMLGCTAAAVAQEIIYHNDGSFTTVQRHGNQNTLFHSDGSFIVEQHVAGRVYGTSSKGWQQGYKRSLTAAEKLNLKGNKKWNSK